MARNDIHSPETWHEFHDENFEDGRPMMLGYCAGISDVRAFVKNLPENLPAEEFKAQILNLCSRGEVLHEHVLQALCDLPEEIRDKFKNKNFPEPPL